MLSVREMEMQEHYKEEFSSHTERSGREVGGGKREEGVMLNEHLLWGRMAVNVHQVTETLDDLVIQSCRLLSKNNVRRDLEGVCVCM